MRFNFPNKGRWKWLLAFIVPVVAFLVAGKTMNTSPPTNSAQTAPDETPELRTRLYWQSASEVVQAAQTVAGEQKTWFKSWRVGPTADNIIRVEIPVLFFTDDMTIRVEQSEGEGETRVNVESKSRVGQGDFGENRRHVAQFLKALDQALIKRGT